MAVATYVTKGENENKYLCQDCSTKCEKDIIASIQDLFMIATKLNILLPEGLGFINKN